MKRIEIIGKSGASRIVLGASINRLGEYYNPDRTMIITDETVRRLHGHLFPQCDVIEIGAGEESKTLDTVESIYDRFLHRELDRFSFIIGIGGGIVCDVAGFAASTYLRGLRFGFVPTTLLAQVDASIGGKNGVNYKGYKNLIGTFNQPEFVLCDFELLKTLPEGELRNGFSEVIKHAIIGDASLFSYLEDEWKNALMLDADVIEKIVSDSLAVKAGIVSIDETEKSKRRKLNFGHTIGHALEKITGNKHGEAISAGMVAAARLSEARGMLSQDDVERIEAVLSNFGLPLRIETDKDMIIDAIRKDKKRSGEEINFVLLHDIGNAEIVPIKIKELEEVIGDLCQHR
ncbi:MAG: 3-dehydroquinate synthase [Proteobacteria bacterium]|nr:3-dehydroquinate synthase [Pseudomonadota bacterium]